MRCSAQYPTYTEGQKSKIKAAVVSTQSLARHAEQIRLGDHLILGRGEEKTGGRFKQALLADAYEALIAAIYLDGGLEAAGAFLRRELKEAIDAGSAQTFAPRLQVGAAGAAAGARARACPNTGSPAKRVPITARLFSIEVVVRGEVLGAATGQGEEGSGAGGRARPRRWRNSAVDGDRRDLRHASAKTGFARLVRAFYAQVPDDDDPRADVSEGRLCRRGRSGCAIF